ncbi:PepSY-like domain-containing protein [Microbacter margulisiae]|uniref:L-ascorbate metabolism protein UlaG (Beta-lactamase superfamily) n=1 Tax=Microbacter margulisiae TaxID=1350067 RepID=A0A7W5H016_9PORP|nr:PepSY-like domain-containing protein [Microbacter margulisiae]MBB3186048.1 L-ascorbate metabolism protein UlaG (beta-lactamase superfamily) [Microbacter margulisiae]
MKRFWFMILAVLFVTSSTFANVKAVPNVVKTSFAKKFQNARTVKWSRENAQEWEADFVLNGHSYSANFDNQGQWKETEHRIPVAEVPEAVNKALKKGFPDYRITEVDLSETPSGETYEFDVIKGALKREVDFNRTGVLIGK